MPAWNQDKTIGNTIHAQVHSALGATVSRCPGVARKPPTINRDPQRVPRIVSLIVEPLIGAR